MSMAVTRESTVQAMMNSPFTSATFQGIRESTVARMGQKNKEEVKQLTEELESKYMKQLQATAKSQSLTEQERKGMLMISQQFERYKAAYDLVKKEKE